MYLIECLGYGAGIVKRESEGIVGERSSSVRSRVLLPTTIYCDGKEQGLCARSRDTIAMHGRERKCAAS